VAAVCCTTPNHRSWPAVNAYSGRLSNLTLRHRYRYIFTQCPLYLWMVFTICSLWNGFTLLLGFVLVAITVRTVSGLFEPVVVFSYTGSDQTPQLLTAETGQMLWPSDMLGWRWFAR